MKAAVLAALDDVRYGDFRDPVAESPDQVVVEVRAAGVNHLDVAKAAGRFYGGVPELPSVVGTDGVGVLPETGERVYFDECVAPFGAMAERTLVARHGLLPVRPEVPDADAAVLGNAGMAAAVSLLWRAELRDGDRVVVLGATGAVGRLAVQLALLHGAAAVVAAGRTRTRLTTLDPVPAFVDLTDLDSLADRLRDAAGGAVDVFVDLVCGPPAERALHAAAVGARYVQVGAKAGDRLTLPAALLRSRLLTVRGSAGFREPAEVRARAYATLQDHRAAGQLVVDSVRFPLAEVRQAWTRQQTGPDGKLVVTPGTQG